MTAKLCHRRFMESVGHLDLHELAVDELAQVVLVERDEVVPRVRGARGEIGHALIVRHALGDSNGSAGPRKPCFRAFPMLAGCPGRPARRPRDTKRSCYEWTPCTSAPLRLRSRATASSCAGIAARTSPTARRCGAIRW